jgi:hypothetical protein
MEEILSFDSRFDARATSHILNLDPERPQLVKKRKRDENDQPHDSPTVIEAKVRQVRTALRYAETEHIAGVPRISISHFGVSSHIITLRPTSRMA